MKPTKVTRYLDMSKIEWIDDEMAITHIEYQGKKYKIIMEETS